MNYQTANKFLTEPRNKASKKIANNTCLVRESQDEIAVKLHDTNVVTFHKDGSIVLNSGGWKTVTTKSRINQYNDKVNIGQVNSVWYVHFNRDGRYYGKSELIFQDGMKISEAGEVTGALPVGYVKIIQKHKKAINGYISKYLDKLFAGKLPQPGPGDCWYCSMRTESGQSLGDISGNDHIKQHIKENYHVPSLLMNAIEKHPVAPVAKWSLAYIWGDEPLETMPEYIKNFAKESFRKSMRAYLYHEFNIAK